MDPDLDADEEALAGRRRKRGLIAALVSLPFLAAMAFGVWFFLDARQTAREKTLVEQVTGAAFGCVASMRGDAPDPWGLERALEHMSRMERVTRDAEDPTGLRERERFAGLALDAARGCRELGSLMMQARAEAPHLYFAVPAKLAQPPEESEAERWFRRILPKSRAEITELTRQIRSMQEAINARRAAHRLMPSALPIEGSVNESLARQVELTALPGGLERGTADAWPLADGALVLRRGSLERVLCDTRYINRASCYSDFVQFVSYTGELSPQRALERPAGVSYWAAFAAAQDGTLWAVGADARDRGVVGRYAVDATTAEIAPFAGPVDAAATMAEVIGGVAVFASDESVWVASSGLAFAPAEHAPMRVVLEPEEGGPEAGVSVDGLGVLSVFGSQEDGFTARLSTPTGDALMRLIDAHSRVRSVTALRALRTGRAVAILQRSADGPDAILLTTDLGRTWLFED